MEADPQGSPLKVPLCGEVPLAGFISQIAYKDGLVCMCYNNCTLNFNSAVERIKHILKEHFKTIITCMVEGHLFLQSSIMLL